MKIKTSELTGRQIDFAVAKCEGWGPAYTFGNYVEGFFVKRAEPVTKLEKLGYSTNWGLAGPIIEREGMAVWWDGTWHAKRDGCQPYEVQDADKPLIAAMRCYVTSKLGNEVDVPDELVLHV